MMPVCRSVLKALCALLLSIGLAAAEAPALAPAESIRAVAKTLGIDVVRQEEAFSVKMTHGSVRGKAVSAALMERYTGVLARELSLYAPELLKRARIARVVVCNGLEYGGQARNGVPDYEHGTLYVEAERGLYALEYMRKVVHHEVFHMVDYRDDGILYDDAEWKKLNPPGFSYARGGAAMQGDARASLPQNAKAGFLNAYSTSGVEEDKAEVFAQLMADAAALKERCASDAVLAKKAERIKALCAKFCAQMDAAYWEGVEKKQRGKEGKR